MVHQNANSWRNFVVDMDGVLWRGETPMPGLAAFFDTLRRQNIPFVLATNNATKVASQYSQKLARFGVAVPEEAILTSAEATASYLHQTYPDAVAYVVGEVGLKQALLRQGLKLIDGDRDGPVEPVDVQQLDQVEHLAGPGDHPAFLVDLDEFVRRPGQVALALGLLEVPVMEHALGHGGV